MLCCIILSFGGDGEKKNILKYLISITKTNFLLMCLLTNKKNLTDPPVNVPAYIVGPKDQTAIVQLGRPAKLRCPAGGYPRIHVYWWHDKERIPLINNRYEQTEDHCLLIKSVTIVDLGKYICEAYSGSGKPSSITITVQTYGPVNYRNPEERQFEKYVLERPRAPVTERPSYPYRPTRPAFIPKVIVAIPVISVIRPVPTVIRSKFSINSMISLDFRMGCNPQ